MPSIDYFFATLSPYCYLAGDRLEKIAAKHDAQTYRVQAHLLECIELRVADGRVVRS